MQRGTESSRLVLDSDFPGTAPKRKRKNSEARDGITVSMSQVTPGVGKKRDIDLEKVKSGDYSSQTDDMIHLWESHIELIKKLQSIKKEEDEIAVIIHGGIGIGKTCFSKMLRDLLVEHGQSVVWTTQTRPSIHEQSKVLNEAVELLSTFQTEYVLIDNFNIGAVHEGALDKLVGDIWKRRLSINTQLPRLIITSSGTSAIYNSLTPGDCKCIVVTFLPTFEELKRCFECEEEVNREQYTHLVHTYSGIGPMLRHVRKGEKMHRDTEKVVGSASLLETVGASLVPPLHLVPGSVLTALSRLSGGGNSSEAALCLLNRCQMLNDKGEFTNNLFYEVPLEKYQIFVSDKNLAQVINSEVNKERSLARRSACICHNNIVGEYERSRPSDYALQSGITAHLYELALISDIRISNVGLKYNENIPPGSTDFHEKCAPLRASGSLREAIEECLVRGEPCQTISLSSPQTRAYHLLHFSRQATDKVTVCLIRIVVNPNQKDTSAMEVEYDLVRERWPAFTFQVSILTDNIQVKGHWDNTCHKSAFNKLIKVMLYNPKTFP